MPARIPPPGSASHYREKDSVEFRLAQMWGVKASTAHQMLYGQRSVRHQVVAAVQSFYGYPDRFATWIRPIESVLKGIRMEVVHLPSLIDQMILRDAEEDVKLGRFLMTGTDEQRAYEHALAKEIEIKERVHTVVRKNRGGL